ncbi:unnamed protein product [Strongylus vulgaris]|uniref:Phlebovirus glycoprotein G2 fusion domain-containing protein n=1 Tax=Strongylus vulgaris TaxID=40348 RepID=A0A3P7LAS0_STRVU|nr:unnamed protein product [Strongylus vulgaris]
MIFFDVVFSSLVLVVPSYTLYDDLACVKDDSRYRIIVEGKSPHTSCARITVTARADMNACPAIKVQIGVSSHLEGFCTRWDATGSKYNKSYSGPLITHELIECQCSIEEKCNGNFPTLFQVVRD